MFVFLVVCLSVCLSIFIRLFLREMAGHDERRETIFAVALHAVTAKVDKELLGCFAAAGSLVLAVRLSVSVSLSLSRAPSLSARCSAFARRTRLHALVSVCCSQASVDRMVCCWSRSLTAWSTDPSGSC